MIDMDDNNPYAPPKSLENERDLLLEHPNAAWRDGKMLMVRKGAVLPDRCLKCNGPAEGYQFTRAVYWHSPAWVLLFLASPILYILVYFLVRWKGKVTVGLCQRHRKRRTRAIALGWLVSLSGIASFFIAGLIDSRDWVGIPIFTGIALLLVGLIGGAVGASVLSPKRIDKNFIWLTGVSPAYLKTFADRNRSD